MEESDVIRLIRQVVREEFAQVLMGKHQDTTATALKISTAVKRFSSEGKIENLRLLHPAGFASLPMDETECLVVPINSDPTHLVVVAQNDKKRPLMTMSKGESAMYNQMMSQVVYLANTGKIHLLSLTAANPALLGTETKDCIDQIFTQLQTLAGDLNTQATDLSTMAGNISSDMLANAGHVHNIITPVPGTPVGPSTSAAANAANAALLVAAAAQYTALATAFTTLQTQFQTLQTQFITTPATNIVSQKVFLERM